MASISAPSFPSPSTYSDPNPQKLSFSRNPKSLPASFSRYSSPLKKSSAQYLNSPSYAHGMYESLICRCQSQPDSPSSPEGFTNGRWDTVLHGVVKNAFKKIEEYLNSYWNRSRISSSIDVAEKESEKEVEDWDWNRWRKHFKEVEEQELIVSILKSQLGYAVSREEYEDAARLKVAIAAASSKDTVGRVISLLNKAIKEERYMDAAFIRDHAGAGLVGWWAGISEDSNDPYGLIIRISAEHGRYVARSYSPRRRSPFEVFLTMNGKGEYKQQAVYLKRDGGILGDKSTKISKSSSATTNLIDGNNDLTTTSMGETEDSEDNDEDNDEAEGLSGFQNVLQDMIPGVKVKVLKVTIPGKVDRDLISKVIEQIMDEEDEEKEAESLETEDEVKAVSDQEQDEIEMDADDGVPDDEERKEIAVKVVVGSLVHKLSRNVPPKDLLRMRARIEKKNRFSFSFSLEENERKQDAGGKGNALQDGKPNLQGQRSLEHVMSDLAKSIISKEKIPMKVLKDVGELINLTLNQAQNRYPLSGSTVFNRIEIPTSADPLNGLYIGAHGLYTSEVIHLRHKFGQWQDDGGMQEKADLEFYEYVEALKLTGDPYIPAGQVAFRAKVGKRNQLPHKGIIPEEFGVVARYRGQGRLAEPGFRNPRWVDGELVILDGKHIRGGPVVGFVYWAPEYHFLVFFSRLRLQK